MYAKNLPAELPGYGLSNYLRMDLSTHFIICRFINHPSLYIQTMVPVVTLAWRRAVILTTATAGEMMECACVTASAQALETAVATLLKSVLRD